MKGARGPRQSPRTLISLLVYHRKGILNSKNAKDFFTEFAKPFSGGFTEKTARNGVSGHLSARNRRPRRAGAKKGGGGDDLPPPRGAFRGLFAAAAADVVDVRLVGVDGADAGGPFGALAQAKLEKAQRDGRQAKTDGRCPEAPTAPSRPTGCSPGTGPAGNRRGAARRRGPWPPGTVRRAAPP